MLTNISSPPRVRWRSSTHTQGLPRYRLSIMPAQNVSSHVPSCHSSTLWEMKDDPTDAELQLELLLTHRDKLQPLHPQSPAMRALEQLVAHRRRVVGDKVRITNRLTSTLKNYFPHVLQWFPDKDTPIFCDFLS